MAEQMAASDGNIYTRLGLTYSASCGRALSTMLTRGNGEYYGHITILFAGDFWQGLSFAQRTAAFLCLSKHRGERFKICNPRHKGSCVYFTSPELGAIRRELIEGPLKGVANAREATRDFGMDDFHSQVVDKDSHLDEVEARATRSGLLTDGSEYVFFPATGYKPNEILPKSGSGAGRPMRHRDQAVPDAATPYPQ